MQICPTHPQRKSLQRSADLGHKRTVFTFDVWTVTKHQSFFMIHIWRSKHQCEPLYLRFLPISTVKLETQTKMHCFDNEKYEIQILTSLFFHHCAWNFSSGTIKNKQTKKKTIPFLFLSPCRWSSHKLCTFKDNFKKRIKLLLSAENNQFSIVLTLKLWRRTFFWLKRE